MEKIFSQNLAIALICLVIALVLIMIAYTFESHMFYFFSIVLTIVGLFFLVIGAGEDTFYQTELINKAIENDYTIYLNGSEVDASRIDIHSYSNVKVDDNNHTIIITVD